ncbi:MAG: phenylalanine--tRNA ligase subunit beta [Dehalococcoidia bacterium]|nr:phenylalanine--tRNA ligase subunit beta [Dehalococcoidia bacterium]
MKASLKWLKDYVDIKLAPKELAERLTMAGMEVKAIQTVGSEWNNMVVGEVVELNPHPNADRLKLATVNLGTQQLTVICGAPNIGIGQKVPFAPVGAHLIDGHTGETVVLKPARIRGIVSEGMVCSEKELGISDRHEGIMVFPEEAPVGMPLNEYLGNVVFDFDITPNRPDCLSVVGIAREVAALTDQPLHLPEIHYEEEENSVSSLVSIDIVEPSLCPRYCASLITGVKIAPSPSWLQQRLSSCGMHPINNIVDVTNYVMLEYGQPLHAFDYDKLSGRQVIVRRATYGETITTLDGVERALNSAILVIADKERAIAIAGIMGGLDTEVTDESTAILLESANFNQIIVRRGCDGLQLQSEASLRFDKGLNPELPLLPLKRATQLLLELAGGKTARDIIDIYPVKSEPKRILLSAEQVKRLSGLEVESRQITKALKLLGFDLQELSSSQFSVCAPYWRSDIKSVADLVEEVVRIVGYDKIPITGLSSPLPAQESTLSLRVQRSNLKQKLRNTLAGSGFQEILTYSLTSLEKLQKLSPKFEVKIPPLKVVNPMTKEQEYLRTNLRAGLLTTLSTNQRHEQAGMRLFEIGKIFLAQGKELPQEREMLCAGLSGSRTELSWHSEKELLDFFDAKGTVENLLRHLGLNASFAPNDDEALSPGRGANIIVDNDKVGIVGNLHPRVTQAFELLTPACLIEIDLEKLLTKLTGARKFQPVVRFPSVTRDIALVVDEQVSYHQVKNIIQDFPLVIDVTLFDLYRGEQISESKKSFAIRIVYQLPSHTLTDEEVNRTQEQMLDRLHRELGSTLRG